MRIAPLFAGPTHHPVVITPSSATGPETLGDYLESERDNLRHLLLIHGAILFRGFGLTGADDFRVCTARVGAQPFEYSGGDSPRSRVVANVYTSTEYPASETISLHNEMSYLPRWPLRLFFFSEVPARSGGQTSLADGRDVKKLLSEDIVGVFRQRKLNYIRHFYPEPLAKSWQATYLTNDRRAVERIAEEQGSSCSWLPGDVLRVSTRCEAIIEHPVTGEELWFNQAEQWHPSALEASARILYEEMLGAGRLPHDCQYGNGDEIAEPVLLQIKAVLNECKLLFDWEQGDLLMLDNARMLHGRESFQGRRRVLAYLSST